MEELNRFTALEEQIQLAYANSMVNKLMVLNGGYSRQTKTGKDVKQIHPQDHSMSQNDSM